MPISAVDSIGPAFQHTKQQLVQPFRFNQWTKLALVGLLAGELSSGGCNTGGFNYNQTGTHRFAADALAAAPANPALYGLLVLFLIMAGVLLFFVFIYVSSVMRFVLFDSVIARTCDIRRGWERRHGAGLRYFAWQLLLLVAGIFGFIILVGIPAAIATAGGWLKEPKAHLLPLIVGGMVLFFLFFGFVVLYLTVHVMSKDFVVPQMALEEISAIEGWRRLLPMLKVEKGAYVGYIGLKVVMTIGVSVVVGIIASIVILIMLIPVGGVGAIVVLAGKTAGLNWNLYTITLAVVVGSVVLAGILYVVSLISVPAIVFFPAYSIYFFGSRYAPLHGLLYPAPPAPAYVAPTPEPLPPPEPIA